MKFRLMWSNCWPSLVVRAEIYHLFCLDHQTLTYIIVKVVRIISPTEMKTMMEMLFRDLALPLKLHIYLVLWH